MTEQPEVDTPSPEDLDDKLPDVLAELAEMTDPDARLRRIHDEIANLAFSATRATEHRWRDKIVAAGYIKIRDWQAISKEARDRVREARRQQQHEQPAEVSYFAGEDGCLYLASPQGTVQLARFVPRVHAEVTRDDGAEQTTMMRIQVTLPTGRVGWVEVPAERLARAGSWAPQAVGTAAVITPMARDERHVSTAAQVLGELAGYTTTTVYLHTGWRDIDGAYRFLTRSGALGADGLDAAVSVELGNERLNRYSLPDPTTADPEELRAAVRASLDLRHVALAKVAVPLLGAAYRAPLPLPPETSIFAVGATGTLKTAYSATVQQHYGRELDARHLPGNWTSTSNYLEGVAFQLANVLMVIDDYAPQSAEDPRRLDTAADRVFRGSANSASRGRQRPDSTLRPVKDPRAQIAATGEDIPSGESKRARLTIVAVDAGAVDRRQLTEAQRQARDGVFELAMAGYVRWLAERQDTDPDYTESLRQRMAQRRETLLDAGHLRTPEAAAGLLVAFREFLTFAVSIEAYTDDEAKPIMDEIAATMKEVATDQGEYVRGMRPADIYVTALRAALTGGHAHLADSGSGEQPVAEPKVWGWREFPVGELTDWRPQGIRIGYVSRDGEVYLDSDTAIQAVRDHARRLGLPFETGKVTVHKRLREAGYLAEVDGKQLTVAKTVMGKRRRVLHVHAALLTENAE